MAACPVTRTWRDNYAGPVVQVRPIAAPFYRHTCEDGHSWTEHANGTVSPSWGLGGTEETWEGYDPKTCPEPERFTRLDFNEYGATVACSSCGEIAAPSELMPGLSCSPYDAWAEAKTTGHHHTAPVPVCLKPPVRTLEWMDIHTLVYRESKGKLGKHPGWTSGWVPIDEKAALEGEPAPPAPPPSVFDDATREAARQLLAAQEKR
jgi:hypothetical protein